MTPKPYIYATLAAIGDNRVRVERYTHTKVNQSYERNGTRSGIVTKVGAGMFKAERLFGNTMHKIFTVKTEGFVINENIAFRDAMKWSVMGYDSFSCSKETQAVLKNLQTK